MEILLRETAGLIVLQASQDFKAENKDQLLSKNIVPKAAYEKIKDLIVLKQK
jgi:hypothetical protein